MTLIEKILEMKGDKPNGLLEDFAVEGGGKYKELEYIIIFRSMGFRCGYVLIPKDHQLYDLPEGYGGLPELEKLNVHGGITFNGYMEDLLEQITELPKDQKKIYLIGFDACHEYDGYDFDARDKIWTSKLLPPREFFLETQSNFLITIKSYEFMEAQCKHLIDQLVGDVVI